MADNDDPSIKSADAEAMCTDLELIEDIRAGARRIRERRIKYLPQYAKESDLAYKIRLAQTPWRPEFSDALGNICSKPFTKPVAVDDDAPDSIQGTMDKATKTRRGGIVDDIDGRGNHLHVFARDTFMSGVADGMRAIYVSYPDVQPARTVAEEKAVGARPYWVHIELKNIIALYTKMLNGREVVSHIRFYECKMEQQGYREVEQRRIRVLELDEANRPTSELWKYDPDSKNYVVEIPKKPLVGVAEIPVALFYTGERFGNFGVRPPMIDLADMQIELYRALSRKEEIMTYAGSPMLKGKGMTPPEPEPQGDISTIPLQERIQRKAENPISQMEVGPRTILFCPADGDWDFIQPDAANITAVQSDVDAIMKDFRRLAKQPTLPQSGA